MPAAFITLPTNRNTGTATSGNESIAYKVRCAIRSSGRLLAKRYTTQGKPIARTSLHGEVTARLRDLIVEGRLKPGLRIAELDVAKSLGVSRTPVREALKVLASEGLVELLQLRGAVVKAFTPKDAQDMLAMIALLEEYAGQPRPAPAAAQAWARPSAEPAAPMGIRITLRRRTARA